MTRAHPVLGASGLATAAVALAVSCLPSGASALDRPIVGTEAMISAGHPAAVESGLKALRAGGTACDAAVAVAATLSVAMTDMMGPLGSGFGLIYDAESGEVSAIDYNGLAPLATDPADFDMETKRRGILAATVPGNLKGWEEIHQRCGVLPWADLWQDAIAYAEARPLDVDSAFHIARHIPELGVQETWVDEFLVDGAALEAGETHSRPELAETYRQFAEQGSAALYGGAVGDQLVAFMEANGGLITQEDLANYSVRWSEPLQMEYRGYTVYGNQPPASSITWMQILNFVEGYDLAAMEHNSPEYLSLLIEASKHAYEDAYKHNADPEFVEVPVDRLLSDEYADEIRESIDTTGVRQFGPVQTGMVYPPEQNHSTSHMVVIDSEGNAVSATNTLGTFFGAGVVVEGTGLLLSNGMDWFDIDENIWTGERPGNLVMEPGKRNRWTLSPGMIFQGDELFMLVGGAGAEATMWGIAQPILNVIEFGMDPQAALEAPRFRYGDIYHYTGGTNIGLDAGMADVARVGLRDLGYTVDDPGTFSNPSRGTTQMIVVDPETGVYWGAAAPQGRDYAAGY